MTSNGLQEFFIGRKWCVYCNEATENVRISSRVFVSPNNCNILSAFCFPYPVKQIMFQLSDITADATVFSSPTCWSAVREILGYLQNECCLFPGAKLPHFKIFFISISFCDKVHWKLNEIKDRASVKFGVTY